jgi:hypothetical protein
MNITIRKTEKKTILQFWNLIKELALFERAPEKVTNTVGLDA